MTAAADQTSGIVVCPSLPLAARWAVLHTKARMEKLVARWLERHQVAHYLPLVTRRRTYGARVRESQVPFFPSYVFFDADVVERRLIYATQRVAKVIVPKDSTLLRLDLENLAQALPKMPDPRRREIGPEGTPVEVVAGPFMGTRGRLLRYGGQTTLVIVVDFIGYGAEMTIDEAWVRAA